MLQKIIKVGNSLAVIIPKRFLEQSKIKIGDKLELEADPRLKLLILKTPDSPYQTTITPEFKSWLDNFIKENKSLLKKLAQTP